MSVYSRCTANPCFIGRLCLLSRTWPFPPHCLHQSRAACNEFVPLVSSVHLEFRVSRVSRVFFVLQESSELAELRAELGDPPEGALTAPQLTTAALLGVMQLYQRWLPEAVADANFDAGRLLNKVTQRR